MRLWLMDECLLWVDCGLKGFTDNGPKAVNCRRATPVESPLNNGYPPLLFSPFVDVSRLYLSMPDCPTETRPAKGLCVILSNR